MSDSIKCRCCNRNLSENDRVVAYVCPACKWCSEYGEDETESLRQQLATLRAAADDIMDFAPPFGLTGLGWHGYVAALQRCSERLEKALSQLSSGGDVGRSTTCPLPARETAADTSNDSGTAHQPSAGDHNDGTERSPLCEDGRSDSKQPATQSGGSIQ